MRQSLLFISALLILVVISAAWWFWHDVQTQLRTPLKLDEEIYYTVHPGMSVQAIANDLSKMGYLRHPHYLVMETRLQGKAGKFKAGEYRISPGITPLELLEIFILGKVVQYTLTLVEGWKFTDVMKAVQEHPHLKNTLTSTDHEVVMQAIGQPGLHPEGQFFPDTYHFPGNSTDIEFLKRAFDRMQQILEGEWQQREEELPYQTSYDALIMASIIEKETGLAKERAAIAGVFVRRLQKNMKLQTDPTVIYALGQQFDGNLRRKDLDIDSPYNTYLYAGLPPTPIALPGKDAIHAALHPGEGNTLYFVARGDGSHYFSETLSEHNKAVAKYQLGNKSSDK